MKTLKIFLKLKYQETIGACLDWLLNWKHALKVTLQFIVLIIIAIFAAVIVFGTFCGMGSLIWWLTPNYFQAYDFDEIMSIGIFSTFGILIITIVTIIFFRWIKENWRKAKELAKE